MASPSKKIHVRSNSLTSASGPSILRVDEELNKLRILETSTASTSGSIYKGLSGLEDLYNCVANLLNLASTQQVLSQHGQEKCVEQLLDESVKILDVHEVTKDILLQIKEHVTSLQSALRRKKGESSIQNSISSFMSFRKKMKKDVKKLIAALKQVDTKCQAMHMESQGLAVIETLREVGLINVSILMSLLQYLSVKPKSSKWSLVLKMMQKTKVACEDKLTCVNELDDVDVALLSLCKCELNNEKVQSAQEKLEALCISTEAIENTLENLIRLVIKTRATILNILSL